MVNVLQGMQYVQQQGELGRQRGVRNRLADLAGQAYAAPQDQQRQLIGQAIQNDPESGFALGQSLGQDRSARVGQLSQKARMLVGYHKAGNVQGVAGMYPQLAREAEALGLAQGIPQQWDDSFLPGMEQLAMLGGGSGGDDLKNVRIGEDGYYYAVQGGQFVNTGVKAAPQNQIIDTGDGFYGVDKRNLGASPVVVGGAQPRQGATAPAENRDAFDQFIAPIIAQADASGQPLTGQEFMELYRQYQANGAGGINVVKGQPGVPQQAPPVAPQLRSAPRAPATPSGYRANPDGSMSMIPGGPAEVAAQARDEARAARQSADAVKAQQKRQGEIARQTAASDSANQLAAAIDSLTQHPGFSELGTTKGDVKIATPLIRSNVKDAAAQLKNISGQVALSTMSSLKALSSSGATGFGALSAPELKLLENSIAALQADEISNEQLAANLKIIREKMEKISGWQPPDETGMYGAAPADAAPASGGNVGAPSPAAGGVLRYNPATGDFE